MRTLLFTALLAASALAGCKWGEFDDLADTTWVHAADDPNIGSTNYAVAIVGVTTQSTGGQIAVVSNDVPNYSTLDYGADGQATVGPNNQKLGVHFIASLSDPVILVTDGNGKVALVERAIDAGNIAVVTGPATAVADKPFASVNTPDAATFAGSSLVIAAGPTLYTQGDTGIPPACTSTDSTFKVAGMASDGTNVFVWTTMGQFGSIPVAALSPCTGGNLPALGSTFTTTGFMPAVGSQVHFVLARYAVLVGHGPTPSSSGQIVVVDTTNMQQVGTTITITDGLKSSAFGGYGGGSYLAVGIPTRSVDGLMSAGQVELYEMAPSTGILNTSPALALNDAQPEAGQEFGHTVTTMKFNGKEILVVGAHSEVFSYYKTALYDALPPQ
ncbi:MAG TPA: hypothetical protein VL326_15285 [Kofleriaceae bacterium]|nr:hypothetical protein [Kofleriaceae bacterium]